MKSHRRNIRSRRRGPSWSPPSSPSSPAPVRSGRTAVRRPPQPRPRPPTTCRPPGATPPPGSIDAPWRTLTYAAGRLAAGDVLYLRDGIYREKVKFRNSGTAAAPIRISAYPGEHPVIDGNNYTLPAPTSRYSQLVTFSGSYVQADGLEVRDSLWHGVAVSGSHVTLTDIVSHDNMEAGILTWGSTRAVVQDSIAYNNAKSNEGGVHKYGRTSYSTGISAGRAPTGRCSGATPLPQLGRGPVHVQRHRHPDGSQHRLRQLQAGVHLRHDGDHRSQEPGRTAPRATPTGCPPR